MKAKLKQVEKLVSDVMEDYSFTQHQACMFIADECGVDHAHVKK